MVGHQTVWFSERELITLSKEQENEFIEKTESLSVDKIAKTICAFSNDLPRREKPSVIFVGIADDGRYTGLSITDDLQLQVSNIRGNGNLQPLPSIRIHTLRIEQHDILAVQVQPSKNPPVRCKNHCWVRIGSSTQEASEQEA